MKIGGFILVLLAFALPATASEPREANDAGFRYLVFETAGAKPDAALPMIVGLHYSSARPEVMIEYFDQIDFPARSYFRRAPIRVATAIRGFRRTTPD